MNMSASELIEEIKKLPASEKRRIKDYLAEEPQPSGAVRFASVAEVKKCGEDLRREYQDLLARLAK
jgi:hypothetical protein